MLSGCASDKNNANSDNDTNSEVNSDSTDIGTGSADNSSELTDIPDEDALNGLKTAAAERIVVTAGADTGTDAVIKTALKRLCNPLRQLLRPTIPL